MSTILEALKKLERDKQTEAAAQRAHDPLAPAPEPVMAPVSSARRGLGLWLVAGGVVVMFAVGVGLGLYTASNDAPPVITLPAEADRTTAIAATQAPPPLAGIEPAEAASVEPLASVSAPAPPPPLAAPSQPAEPPPIAPPSSPAEPEPVAAVSAAPPVVPVIAATASPTTAAPPAPSGAAGDGAALARTPTPDPWEAAALAEDEDTESQPEPARVEAPSPVAAGPPAGSAVAVDPAPVAESPPDPAAETSPSTVAESSATPVADEAPSAPKLGEVVVPDADGRLEVKVLKTVWHPKAERRWARIEVAGAEGAVEVREADTIEGYRVEEITPSSVVLSRGSVTVTHRVGR